MPRLDDGDSCTVTGTLACEELLATELGSTGTVHGSGGRPADLAWIWVTQGDITACSEISKGAQLSVVEVKPDGEWPCKGEAAKCYEKSKKSKQRHRWVSQADGN